MSGNKVLIGLDLGTTNSKAIAYTATGDLVAELRVPYPTYYPQSGWAEQNPQDWINALKSSLSQLSTELSKCRLHPIGLGVSAHAPGLILTDENGQPLAETFPIWQDGRSLPQSQQLSRDLGLNWVGLGLPMAAFAAKLLWFTQHRPDLIERARYALGVKSYLIHWLTGNFVTDPSSEPGNEPKWLELCQYCGWSLDRLPKVLSPTELVGVVRHKLSDEIGLPPDLPVISGMNDGASATLANGALESGEGVIQLATNGVVYLSTQLQIAPEIRYQHSIFNWPYLDNHWIAGGQTKCGAINLEWLAKIISGDNNNSQIELLLAEASTSPPGSNGVIYLPFLMGHGTPHDDMISRGSFSGLDLSTRRAHLCRAVLEGVAFSIREIFEDFELLGIIPSQIFITGGGARSQLWQQIIANILDRSITFCAADSCLGGAILAAVGLGIHTNLYEAVQTMVHPVNRVEPQNELVDCYRDIYRKYIHLSRVLFEIQ